MIVRICPICGKDFYFPHITTAKYCTNNEWTKNNETTHSSRPRARGKRKDT